MSGREHFRPAVDTTVTPEEQGRWAAGRGHSLDECPFDEPENIRLWQQGWQAKMAHLRRWNRVAR